MKESDGGMKHCCEDMKINIEENMLISYNEVFDEYGINVPEDGCSYILVEYCPWCGRKLPVSKREQWFEELEKLGFEDPLFDETIPAIYKSGEWRKKCSDMEFAPTLGRPYPYSILEKE